MAEAHMMERDLNPIVTSVTELEEILEIIAPKSIDEGWDVPLVV